jgi:hypothetical protein
MAGQEEDGMNNSPKEFLAAWRESFIDNETVELEDLDALMAELLEDAAEEGVSRQELDKAAHGDLRGYLTTAIRVRSRDLQAAAVE